jgi:hypothetical protein
LKQRFLVESGAEESMKSQISLNRRSAAKHLDKLLDDALEQTYLAIAHMAEPRLAGAGGQLSGPQWDQLVASCCNLKDFAATGPPDERFVVALAGRGSGMVAGSQAATVMRAEIEGVLLDGSTMSSNSGPSARRTAANRATSSAT